MASAPSSKRQEEHYEAIHDDYARHYYDRGSTAYRDRFINSALFDGLALEGCRVAEIMCGDGPLTAYLRRHHEAVEIEGFDISAKACEAYVKATGCRAIVVDITQSPLPAERFDVIAVSGGLHHVAHHLEATLRNIHRALKPGGRLVAFEPNSRYLLEGLRRIWYRRDALFDAENEAALDDRALGRLMAGMFECESISYGGGPGYFLVLNSLIFRVPAGLKSLYSPPIIALESLWNLMPIIGLQAYFVARWRKL
jgi:SAM-dependent methyltransferase